MEELNFTPQNGGDPTLKEADRKKLDGIVSQMEQNGESAAAIKLVVNDFKNKYGQKSKGVSAGVVKSGGSQSTSATGVSSWGSWEKPKTNTVGGTQFAKKSQPLIEVERATTQQKTKLSDTGISKKDQEKLIKQSEDRRPEIQNKLVTSEVDYQKGLERNYENTGDDSEIIEYLTKSPTNKYKQGFLLQSKSGEFLDIPTNPYENKIDPNTLEEVYKAIPNVDQSGTNPNDFAGYLKERSDFIKQDKAGVFNNPKEREFEINRLYNDYFSRKARLLNSKADILLNRSKTDGKNRDEEIKQIGQELQGLGEGYNQYKKANLPNIYKAEQEKREKDLKNYNDIKNGDRSFLQDVDTAGQKFIDGFMYSVSDVLAAGADVVGSDFLGDKLRLQKQFKTWENDTNTIPFYDKGKVVKDGGETFIVTNEGTVIDKDTKTIVNGIFDPNRLKSIIDSSTSSKEVESVFSGRGATYAMSQTLGQLAFQLAGTKAIGGGIGKIGVGGSAKMLAGEMISVGSMVGTTAYNDTLNELKKAGIKEDEAKGLATQVGLSMALIGATSARFLPNSRSLNWVTQTGTRQATRQAVDLFLRGGSEEMKSFLKSGAVRTVVEGVKEGGGEMIQETFENYMNQEVINKNINKQIGQTVLDQNYTVKEAINDAALSFGAAGITGAMGSSRKAGQYDTLAILSQDYDNFVRFGQEEVYRGKMSQSEFNDLKDSVEKFKKYNNRIPSNVQPDKILDLINVLDEKNNLEQEKKNLDKVFHPEIDEKIETLNSQVDEILNRTEPTPDTEQTAQPEEEQDLYSLESMNSLPLLDETYQNEYDRSLDVINSADWSNPESAKQAASEVANIISGKNIPDSKLESYLSNKLIPTDNVFTPEHLEKFVNLSIRDFNVNNEATINNEQTTKQTQETTANQEGENTIDDEIPTEASEEIDLEADLNEPTAFDKFINGIDKLINDIDESTKGTLGINILPVAAKGALQAIKQTAIATKNTVQAINAGIEYLKSTDWYKNLTSDEKSEFDSKTGNEVFGDLMKSVKGIDNKVTTTESKLLKDKLNDLKRGYKTGAKEVQKFKKDFIEQVKSSIKGLGNNITESDANTILNQVSKVTPDNIDSVSKIIDNLVSRLENRASKARVNKLKSLQKRANVKARTKYGNAGKDIRKLTTLPANQIPDTQFDEYYDLMEQLAKGQDVDFNRVSEMYQSLQDSINQFVENKNKEKSERVREVKDNTEEVDKFKINVKKTPNLKNLTDFEREIVSKLKNIPESYIASLPKSEIASLNKALEALNNSGYLPNKTVSNIVLKYNSEVTAAEVINTVGDRILKPAKGIFNLIDKIRGKEYTSKDFTNAIGKEMLHHIQRAIKGISGTLFYDNIIHPITSNFDKASVETNHIANKFTSIFNKAAKKNGFALNVKLQMYLRAREFESNPELRGKKVFSLEEHMKAMEENAALLSIPKKDIEYILAEYNKVKNQSSEEMFNNFTQDEKAVVEFMDQELSKSEVASRDFNNHLGGETLLYPKNYFPRKNSLVTGNNDVDADIKNRLAGVLGSSSIKSDQSNERTANTANPLNFDTAGNFMSHIRQSNIEKNLGFTLKEVGMTVSNIKKSSNESLVSLANSLEVTINNLLEAQLGKNPFSYDSKKEKLFKALVKNTFTRMLIDPIRLSYDVISNYSTVYGFHLDKLGDIIKANKNISNDINAEIHKNISSTQAERLGGSRSSDYKNAMSSSLNQARNKTSEPSLGDRLLDLYRYNILSKFSEEGGNLYYKVADLPSQHLWKYYLSEEFKNITGQELNGEKYLEDKAYRESIKDDLQKAATRADKKTANFFNTGASAEQKLIIQLDRGNFLTRANNFLRSFTFNENRVFWDSLSGLTGFGDSTFDSKTEAFRAFATINARGIMYSYLGQMVAGWILKFALEDDEKEEEAIDQKALKRALGQHGMLIIGGNRGAIFNLVGNFVFEEVNKQVMKSQGKKYDPYEDNIFYTPNSKSKYLDFLNNLGAEGAVVKTAVEFLGIFYKVGEKLATEGKVTQEDLIKMKAAQIGFQTIAQTFGLPLDRIGRITQKYLSQKPKKDKKKPYEFK